MTDPSEDCCQRHGHLSLADVLECEAEEHGPDAVLNAVKEALCGG